jgi:hypothetical protein
MGAVLTKLIRLQQKEGTSPHGRDTLCFFGSLVSAWTAVDGTHSERRPPPMPPAAVVMPESLTESPGSGSSARVYLGPKLSILYHKKTAKSIMITKIIVISIFNLSYYCNILMVGNRKPISTKGRQNHAGGL